MKTLIIDNYDSFTFNLYQMLGEVNGAPPTVVRNDADWSAVPWSAFDNIVISPGPGRPQRDADFGICRRAIAEADVPMLCVCLGHQGLGHLHGARVELAPEPVHGRRSAVYHDGSALFAGIPQGTQVVRYHSLILARDLPDDIVPIAWTEDDLLMGIRHRTRPLWGVQFHPESIGTEHGEELLRNFRDITRAHHQRTRAHAPEHAPPDISDVSVIPRRTPAGRANGAHADGANGAHANRANGKHARAFEMHVRALDGDQVDPEQAFVALYGSASNAFWLDSSLATPASRFHFMGDASGPLSEVVRYRVRERRVEVTTPASRTFHDESIFTYLVRALEERAIPPDPDLPFDFSCGYVGYFGYELKAECGGDDVHPAATPDAYFVFADRVLAFDTASARLYLLCLTEAGHEADAERFFDDIEARLDALAPLPPIRPLPPDTPLRFQLAHSRARYLDDIAACLQQIRQGETYEVCLTNRIRTELDASPLDYHRTLRRANPAPYAAYLHCGDFCVASSSPERFLRIDRERWAESKPIKGTLPRGRTPEEDAALREQLRTSEKDRSENLMIVDLVRNDLGVVCEVGTVHVPKYMHVESYATVHQLVSTIRGHLRDDMTAVDCVQAAFPGGSMTGAPKIRTMQIIDLLEPDARGVYSGSIGWLGCNGAADLNIVIRTAVFHPQGTTIGVGGAIVALSDAQAEVEETLLKGRALMRAALAMVEPTDNAPEAALGAD